MLLQTPNSLVFKATSGSFNIWQKARELSAIFGNGRAYAYVNLHAKAL